MGVLLRFAGVGLRAGVVLGLSLGWVWLGQPSGARSDDMTSLLVLFVLAGQVSLVWGFVDGVRWPVRKALTVWQLATLCAAAAAVVALGPGRVDAFAAMVVGGMFVMFVLVPASVGAAGGCSARFVAGRVRSRVLRSGAGTGTP